MTSEAILTAVLILALRILNYAISTIRLVAITRQKRMAASVLAFFEALIFAVVIANVVTDLSDNLLNLIAYCAGASIGSYLGIVLEGRFVTSYRTVNVISSQRGHEIATALRSAGYGVTETLGEGLEGAVTLLRSVVVNRDVPKILAIIKGVNPDAFVAVEEARAVQRGWLRAPAGLK